MNLFQRWIAPLLILVLTALSVGAQVSPYTPQAIQAIPPHIAGRDFPAMMMLAASRDHTLFGPMYTDYEDLTGSGRINPTYVPTFEYYGYFDPTKCYGYEGEKFVPKAIRHATNWCKGLDEGRWSGNFLNWASMSRIDVVRKMLYGGSRFVDEPNSTVLQTALLGYDAHAFAKYYRGDDIGLYTPFDAEQLKDANGKKVGLTTCAMSYAPAPNDKQDPTLPEYGVPILRMVKGNYLLWSTSAMRVCQWRPAEDPSASVNKNHWFGVKLVEYFKRDAAIVNSDLFDAPDHGAISPYPNSSALPAGVGANGLVLRVQACVDGLVGKENCKRFEYGDAGQKKYSLKPVGILQDYGWAPSVGNHARAEFGLISGSYDAPLNGGILRKNIGSLNDEINPDGTFCHLVKDKTKNSADCSTTGGVIKSFDAFRLFAAASKYSKIGFTWLQPSELEKDLALQARFPSWGNPVGEMMLQTLAYFAKKGTSAQYKSEVAPSTDSYDGDVGLPTSQWVDPLDDSLPVAGSGQQSRGLTYGQSICRPLNMLAISSSALSFDRDASLFSTLPNTEGNELSVFTNAIGAREGINQTIRSVASIDGGWGAECSGKTVTLLSQVTGICPEAPASQGSFMAAGAALYGNTRAIRSVEVGGKTDIPGYPSASDLPKDLPAYALRVKTLAAAMGGGVARIEVVHPTSGAVAYITPTSLWKPSSTKLISGALLTIKLLNSESDPTTKKTIAASYVVTWNDAQFGGDYDMDIVGYLSYRIEGNLIKVTSDILNVDAGMQGSHGFSIVGAVNEPGVYITHAANGMEYGDCLALKGKPEFALRCNFKDAGMPTASQGSVVSDDWAWPTIFNGQKVGFGFLETETKNTFTFNSSAGKSVLQDPLWYAAKYGSFKTGETSFSTAFDFTKNGLPTEASPSDGYFLARDPAKLELGLRRALDKVLAAGNSTPAVSTAQLISTSLKYVAEFDAKAQTGTVKAYGLTGEGKFTTDPKFELGQQLTDASLAGKRQVITDDGRNGLPLTVAALGNTANPGLAPYRVAFSGGQAGDAWMDLVAYARGGTAPQGLRPRLSNVMGPIVNATPWLQRGALLRTTDVDLPSGWASYREFAQARLTSSSQDILWVASNDAMLHGFNASTGMPVLSYLPSQLVGAFRQAHLESNSEVTATLDGSPFTGDVYVGGAWRTYLFASLGRGGKGLFALDVTSTSSDALKEAAATSVFKWNFTAQDDSDVGHMLIDPVIHRASGQPANIIRMNDGKFRLMMPNGYGSASGRATVFLLDLEGRTQAGDWQNRYVSLTAAASESGNGMMGVTWVDIDNNGTADWIYATDLKGQLWKFDVSSTDPNKWGHAFLDAASLPQPLFAARSGSKGDGLPLSISTSPVVTYPGLGGVLVGFGTGKAITSADFPRTDLTQRMYMIWDRGNFSADLSSASVKNKRALPSHTSLLGRRLVRNDQTQRVTIDATDEAKSLDWSKHDGWYLDFPVANSSQIGTGEMVLSTPVVRAGVMFFTTVRPQTETNVCQTTPIAALYAVTPVSGKAEKLLLPGDGTIGMLIGDSKTLVVSDQTVGQGGVEPGKEMLRVVGRDWDMKVSPSTSSGRIQWRVIPGLKTH